MFRLPTRRCKSCVASLMGGDSSRQRRGTTTVEFAIVALPLFLFIFSSIEFGRAMMVMNTLEEAARCGCRVAILKNATEAGIEDEVDEMLSLNGIDVYSVDYSPQPLSSADQWTPVTVTVTATFGDVSWLPMPDFLAEVAYTASATMPKECRAN